MAADISPLIADLHRKNLSAVLKSMSAISQVRIAEMMGVSEATVSRMKDDGGLEKFVALLSACQLVAQPRTYKSISPDRLRALEILARDSLDAPSEWGQIE